MASTAKVPEPCIGTVTKRSSPWMTRGRPSSTALLIAMKAASREPQSWTMTSLTDFAVVRGPGVSSSGSPVSEAARIAGMGVFEAFSMRGNLALPGVLVESLQTDQRHADHDQRRRRGAGRNERLLEKKHRDQRSPEHARLAQRGDERDRRDGHGPDRDPVGAERHRPAGDAAAEELPHRRQSGKAAQPQRHEHEGNAV